MFGQTQSIAIILEGLSQICVANCAVTVFTPLKGITMQLPTTDVDNQTSASIAKSALKPYQDTRQASPSQRQFL
jgi:hypothetical protein